MAFYVGQEVAAAENPAAERSAAGFFFISQDFQNHRFSESARDTKELSPRH